MPEIINGLFQDYLEPTGTNDPRQQQLIGNQATQEGYYQPAYNPTPEYQPLPEYQEQEQNRPLTEAENKPEMLADTAVHVMSQPPVTQGSLGFDPSLLSEEDLANLDLSGLDAEALNNLTYQDVTASLTGVSPAPTSAEGWANLYGQYGQTLSAGMSPNIDIDDRTYAYNYALATQGGMDYQGTPEELRAAAGLPDTFSVYDNPQAGITTENAQGAYQALTSTTDPMEALSQYYGIDLQAATPNEQSVYTNAELYGTTAENMAEFQSVITPVLQQVIPYIQMTQGLRFDDALEYAYKHDPMVAAIYNKYGVDLFRQTDDGSTYFYDPFSGLEARTVEVKDTSFRDVGLALSLAAVGAMLGPVIGGPVTEALALEGATATAVNAAITNGLTTALQGGDFKDILTSAVTAGVTGPLNQYVGNALGVSDEIAAGIVEAGLQKAQGADTEAALLSGFIAAGSEWLRGQLPADEADVAALQERANLENITGEQALTGSGDIINTVSSRDARNALTQAINSNPSATLSEIIVTAQRIAPDLTSAVWDTVTNELTTAISSTSTGGMLTGDSPAGGMEEVVVTGRQTVGDTEYFTSSTGFILDPETLQPLGRRVVEGANGVIYFFDEGDTPLNEAGYGLADSFTKLYGDNRWQEWLEGITPENSKSLFGHEITWDMIYGNQDLPSAVVERLNEDVTQGNEELFTEITKPEYIPPTEQPELPPTDTSVEIPEVDIENLPPEVVVDTTPPTPPTPPDNVQVPTNVTGGGSAGGATGGGLLTGQTTTQPAGTTTQPAGGTTQTVVDTTSTTQPTTQTQAQQTATDILTHATSGGEYREDYDYNNDGRVTSADALMALKLGGVSREDLFGYVETIFGSTVDDITASLDSIGDLEEQITTGQEIIGAVTDERDALAGQVTTLEGQLADAQAAADAAVAAGDANAAALQANADAIQEQLNATTVELDNANATITGLETELGTTQETLAATQEQLATTQEERDAAQTAVADLTGLLDTANVDLETKTAEIENLNSTVETLNTDIEVLTGDLDMANATVAGLEEQLQTAKDTNADNVADLESQLKDAQDNAAGIQESLDAKTTELADANATIETLNGEVETLNTTVEDLNGQLEAKQGELDIANTTIADLTDKLGTSEAANVELTNQLNEANTEVATLEGNLETAQQINTELTNNLEAANSTVETLTGQLEDANAELDALKDEYAAAVVANQENVDELEQAVKDKEGEVAGLEGDLADANATIEDLEGQLSDNEEEISGLEGSLADALATIAGLEGDLAASQAATETAIAEGQAAAEAAGEAGYETGYGEGFGTGYGEGEGAGYGKGFGSGMLSASANQPVTTRPLPDMPEVKYGVPLASLFGTTDYMQQLLERLRA